MTASLEPRTQSWARAHRQRVLTALLYAGADTRPANENEAEDWLGAIEEQAATEARRELWSEIALESIPRGMTAQAYRKSILARIDRLIEDSDV